jgi:hypothetical protein
MALVNFRKKFESFPLIFARISNFVHFRGDCECAYAEPKFFGELFKFCFVFYVHLDSIRWVSRRFVKIFINYSRNLHFIWYF